MKVDGIQRRPTKASSRYYWSITPKKRDFKRIALCLVLFLALSTINLSGFIIPATKANAAIGPAVFFLNHQDDEMWLAGAIKEHLDSGRETHVVMATTGDRSNARNIINGKNDAGTPVYCPDHKKYHNPASEGYTKLSIRDFAAARNVEFFETMKTLGVPTANIHFANQDINPDLLPGENYTTAWASPKFIDTQLTKVQATQIINYYRGIFGEGGYKCIATGAGLPYSDYIHNDHKNFFLALNEHTGISDKRFYTNTSYGSKKYLSAAQISAKKSALSNYYVWDPQDGRFAVGKHSVVNLLNTWSNNGYEYIFSDKTPPANPLDLEAKPASSKIDLSWKNPVVSDFGGVLLRRKTGSYPSSPTDGTQIYRGTASVISDTSGLINGTVYYYKLFSYDVVSNYSSGITTTAIPFEGDVTAPILSNINSTVYSVSASISWTSNESATSQIEYGLTEAYGFLTLQSTTKKTSHSQSLGNLLPLTTYHYRVKSLDAAGNIGLSSDRQLTTTAIPDTDMPVLTDVHIERIGSTSVDVAWTSNEPTTSLVHYGLTTSYGNQTPLDAVMRISHLVVITGLNPGITYNFSVDSADAAGNISSSTNLPFTTSSADISGPVITDTVIGNPNFNSVSISWKTNEPAISSISYGTNAGNLNLQKEVAVTPLVSHSTFLGGLIPSTKYYFVARSDDESGNSTSSGQGTFQTANLADETAPLISNITVSSTTSTTATISWNTNEVSNSKVHYGDDENYGLYTPDNISANTSHTIKLTGLTPQSSYHFSVSNTDPSGNTSEGPDTIFVTNDQPEIPISENTPFDISNDKLSTSKDGVTLVLRSELGDEILGMNIDVVEIGLGSRQAPEGYQIWRALDLSAYEQEGYAVYDNFVFEVTLQLNDTFTGKDFLIRYWDGHEWSENGISNARFNALTNSVTFEVNHFSEFAVFGNSTAVKGATNAISTKGSATLLPSTGQENLGHFVNLLLSIILSTILIMILNRTKFLLFK